MLGLLGRRKLRCLTYNKCKQKTPYGSFLFYKKFFYKIQKYIYRKWGSHRYFNDILQTSTSPLSIFIFFSTYIHSVYPVHNYDDHISALTYTNKVFFKSDSNIDFNRFLKTIIPTSQNHLRPDPLPDQNL